MTLRSMKMVIALGVLAGCSGAEPPPRLRVREARVPPSENPARAAAVPRGPWGCGVARPQQPWSGTNCAGQPYGLYNDDFCSAAFTVVIRSEPWCAACLVEGPSVRANLIDPYALMGVRFLEILTQTASYDTVDAATCEAWASEYNTGEYTFMDPTRAVSTYNYTPGIDETPPATRTESLPVVNIYDSTGTLVFHHEGETSNWRDITTALDGLLAGVAP